MPNILLRMLMASDKSRETMLPTSEEYQSMFTDAKAAVRGITDPELKAAALNAVFSQIISWHRHKPSKPWRYFSYDFNYKPVLIAFALSAVGCLSLLGGLSPIVSGVTAALIDIFIVYLLVIVGYYADGYKDTYDQMPHRVPALLIAALLFVGLMSSFANMYLKSGGVCPGGSDCPVQSQCCDISKAISPAAQSKLDMVYFSCVTMTTLGYGDFSPVSRPAKWLVMSHLLSSLALILLLFPLILSRLANY